ncbi:serine/threonine-protein kinase [Streptomyces sp. NPDC051907]|uniref:serine/threonine-protein kinase n=1 Tax=Streptomyces sp. NPDC051907 TaxID=3155284 RepID=UPI0034364FF5
MTGVRIQPLSAEDPRQLGRYRLIGRLSSGGMGRIYLAKADGDDRLVAVKTLLAEGVVADSDRRRFAREVKLARRIDSAYTAKVRDADPEAERPWMAIDYIAAPSLAELVRTVGVLPASAVRWAAAGTAEALVTLHREGVVHRDVKPQNILLPLSGPRLIDFGISHATDITRTTLTLGTIAFTSPEQARGEPSTSASDVYSLGATLFHLAVGRPPYPEGEDTLRLLARVSRGDLDLAGLPKELAPMVRPCLAAAPGERPEPADVLAQFMQGLAGLPTSHSGRRWLPPRWTELIERYERDGRELARGSSDDDPTVDQRTRATPPPDPTRVYTQDRARADRERRAREERAQQEERAEQEKREREKQERERVERVEREARERRAQERRDKEREEARKKEEQQKEARKEERKEEERLRKERARAASAMSARAGSGSGGAAQPRRKARSTTPAAARKPPAAPVTPVTPVKKSSTGWIAVPLIALLLWIWQPWESESASRTGSTRGTSGSSATLGSGGTSSTAGSSGDSTNAGSAPSSGPTPDSEDVAFRAVRTGDCLSAYADGRDGWSTPTPQRVACGSATAYTRVTAARSGVAFGDCPTGHGRAYWYHRGSLPAYGVSLCVERQFRKGECFVAKRTGTQVTTSLLTNVWSCDATTVPAGYNEVLQITGYYKAQASYPRGFCSQGQYDQNYYWYYEVDGGRSVLCTKEA